MGVLQSIQALVISAVMFVNPLLLPPDLRPDYQPTINKQLASVKPVVIENPINAINLISKINQKRSGEKLLPLTINSKLSAAAEKKINSYEETKKWEMPSGELDNLLTNSGYSNNHAGMAMTRDFNDLDGVIRGILNDETTKDTILTKNGKDIGVAVRFISSPYKHLVAIVISATPEIQPVAVQPTQKQTAPVGNQIDCTGPDGKHLFVTQKECDDFNNAWGKNNSNSNTNIQKSPSNTQTAPSSANTVYCWDNTYKVGYYTTSGDKCNSDNSKSFSYEICIGNQHAKNNTCTAPCTSQTSKEIDVCQWAYTTEDAGVVRDENKYNECTNEAYANRDKCFSKCLEQYVQDIKQCQ